MPERSWCTESWTESQWFQTLNPYQRYLFWYLCTNEHCKQAGLYYITLPTMAFETKLSEDELTDLLKSLSPRVEWYPERNLVWVRNFIKRQYKSPKFLIAAANCLEKLKERDKAIVEELIEYNYTMHSLSIPYGNNTDTSLTPYTKPNTNPKEGIGQLMREVFAGLKRRRGYNSRQPKAEAQAIKDMLGEGVKPDDILRAYDIIKARPFFQEKNLSMMQVKKDIHEVLKRGAHQRGTKKTSTEELKESVRPGASLSE